MESKISNTVISSSGSESLRKTIKGENTEGEQEGPVKDTGQDPPCKKLRGGQHEANPSSSKKPVIQATERPSLVESDTSSSNNPARATTRKARSEELDSGSCSSRPAKTRHVQSDTSNRTTGLSGKKDTSTSTCFVKE